MFNSNGNLIKNSLELNMQLIFKSKTKKIGFQNRDNMQKLSIILSITSICYD